MPRLYRCDCVLFCYQTVEAEDMDEAEQKVLKGCNADTADDYDCECRLEEAPEE